ncbi:MAG: LysM peptidoglycan-binding domain-containing protein [Cytophagaceae bacterium]|nr:LysM peptidoglycan-binding domain-containing protein [Cytophagaceae bacterium]
MTRNYYTAIVFFICFLSQTITIAQIVPDRIEFAGMQLFLTKKAKARVQADVDMIKKSTTYFQQKVDRANLFFPVIEKVFVEEGFPSEFKYLALQESSLVSDAVSSSQAVGYWQFKKESAVEVGVKVDHRVDERMNIYASSRGAAKYLKRNQGVLNNWVYTLLSYNMGLGGVRSQVNNEYVGAQQMEIDEDMHWYVFRFLAHKIAYEGMVGNAHHSSLHLIAYKLSEQKKLQDIAKEANLDEQLVLDYNKWCLHKEVPGDKEYTVILPVPVADREQYIAKYEKGNASTITPVHPPVIVSIEPTPGTIVDKEGVAYTSIDEVPDWTKAPMRVSINRVKALRIAVSDDIHTITLTSGISKEGFLRFNEITVSHQLIPGNYYYLQLKRTKALVPYHTVRKGESIWSIAQHYGMKQSAILSKNRMAKHEAIKEGRVLWLRDKRPKDTPIEFKKIEEVKPAEVKPIVVKPIPFNDTITPIIQETLLLNDQYIYHVVKQGETMFGISRSYYVSSDSILHWNGMNDYFIKTGQNLIVGRKLKGMPVKHIVKQGETLYKIAQQYHVEVSSILKNNSKTEASIKIGEELIISQ